MFGAMVATGVFARRLGYLSRTYSLCLALAGVGIIGYTRSTTLWVAFVVLFLTGVPIAAVNSVVGPIILRVTPRSNLIGRVVSVLNPALQVTSMLSIGLAGWLASTLLHGWSGRLLGLHLRTYDTIYGVGGLLVVAGGIWALAILPAAVRAETVDDPTATSTADATATADAAGDPTGTPAAEAAGAA